LRLNLGSGGRVIEGYTNIDIDKKCGADIISNILDLKFEDETVEEIYFSHCLEHLNRNDAQTMLNRCYKWLKVAGRMWISVPNLKLICDLMNIYDDEILMRWMYGDGNDRLPLNHQWGYSEKSLKKCLNQAGFKKIEPFEPMYKDDSCFKFKEMYLSINWVCEK
jgi:predicted SAM-dependent methyltransferase